MVHDNAPKICEFASILTGLGHDVFIHLDGSVSDTARERYMAAVNEVVPQATFVHPVRCEWGSWNLVEGTLSLVRAVVASGKPFTHVQLLSGADLPTQNIGYFGDFLLRNPDSDFIESVDVSVSRWVVHGPEKERFHYYFPFNWRRQRKLFDMFFALQRFCGVKRNIPCGIRPRLGSQWWTLRLATCRKLVEFLDQYPGVCRYFKKVLIPDECFFQSIVPHLVDSREIVPRTLTLYQFTGYGKPFVFYDDHLEMLVEQPFFFARKVSPVAKILQKALFDRALSGPRPEWQDDRAGQISWKFQVESTRAFRFRDPIVGHIGNSKHHALKNPVQHCVVLACTDPAVRFATEQQLSQTRGVHCINSFELPPYRAYGHASLPTLNSFLANELSLASGLVTCICTTVTDFPDLIYGLDRLDGPDGKQAVKARCAVIETAELTIDQRALRRTVHDWAYEKIIVQLVRGEIPAALPAEIGSKYPGEEDAFPAFLQDQFAELIDCIKEPVVQFEGGHLVRLRRNAAKTPGHPSTIQSRSHCH